MPRKTKTDRRKLFTIELAAPTDTYGNPRRVFLLYNRQWKCVDAIDEGYGGWGAVTEYGGTSGWVYPNAVRGPTFPTTTKEYKRLLRWWERR